MSEGEVLRVEGLRVDTSRGHPIVDDVSLALAPGEILAIVGESGSGKTTAALAMLGYARRGARISGGSVRVAGEEILGRGEGEQRRLRGSLIAYVPQDPATSLNPGMRVGDQVAVMLAEHNPGHDPGAAVAQILERVGLPGDRTFQRRFPHQLSGGQQQRVAIAVALVCQPRVVVLDEPTTALDVVTQALILDEIRRLRSELGLAMVYVSHDLAVVASIAARIAVMYAGTIVEEASAEELFGSARHPYTRGLLNSVPDHVVPRKLHGIPGTASGPESRPPGCAFAPRCALRNEACVRSVPPPAEIAPDHRVRCYEWHRTRPAMSLSPRELERGLSSPEPLLRVADLSAVHRTRRGPTTVLTGISLDVATGESVALVGESGSGKTTIARCVAGLHPPAGGRILFHGEMLAPAAQDRSREERRRIQLVFQNPYDSLNPQHTVADAIARTARVLRGLGRRESEQETGRILELVRLPQAAAPRYPAELSGGERQRVAIARALAASPELLICDEITSALDVSVQAAVIELLETLRTELRLSLLFISHDLGVVASVADRLLVLEHGHVREQGPLVDVLHRPSADYTRRLIAAVPGIPATQATTDHQGVR